MIAEVSELLFARVKQSFWCLGAAAIRAASKTMAKPASDVAPPVGGAENKASKSSEDSSAVAKVIKALVFIYKRILID